MLKTKLQQVAIAATTAIPSMALGATPALADYYGAIAYSRSTQGHGYSYDYRDQASAETWALQECARASGGRDCQVVISFRNACGALAKSPRGSYGSGWGNNRTLAEGYAVQSCSQHDRGCQVLRWVCTTR